MAWSDSLFASHDMEKLNFLAKCCSASYQGGRQAIQDFVGTQVIRLQTDGAPFGYTFWKDGSQLLLIDGTTSSDQYALQALGWTHPVAFGTSGLANAFHLNAAAKIWQVGPVSPELVFGHSMGGAIAAMLARVYAVAGRSTRAVTFGAPRPVNQAAATGLQWPAERHYRLPLDPVPFLPTDGPLAIQWRLPGQCFSLANPGVEAITDQSASPFELAVILGQYGAFYHFVSSYSEATATGVPPKFQPPKVPEGNMLYRVTIIGSMHGQAANNSIDYRLPDNTPLADILAEFRTQWCQQVVAKVSSQYRALDYRVQRLGDAKLFTKPDDTQWSKLVFVESRTLAGNEAADIGGKNEQAFPSHDALGIIKQAFKWKDAAGADITANVPPPKGGALGIAGIVESSTDKDVNGNNGLIPADLLAWKNVANNLRTWDSAAGFTFQMVVISYIRDKAPIMAAGGVLATYNYSLVEQCVVNPFVTTRNSRKQRRNRNA